MARKVNPIFNGLEMSYIRPGAYATDLDAGNMVGDQAHTYEVLTNQPTPGNPALTVDAGAPHNHSVNDGNVPVISHRTGAPIRHPIFTCVMQAGLNVRTENLVADEDLRVPFFWCPVYIPKGTDVIQVGMAFARDDNLPDRRKRIELKVAQGTPTNYLDQTFFFSRSVSGKTFYLPEIGGDNARQFEFSTATINEAANPLWPLGGIYYFKITVYDGYSYINPDPSFLPTNQAESPDSEKVFYHFIQSIVIVPLKSKPPPVPYSYHAPLTINPEVTTPDEFQPVEEDMVDVDKSINSAVCTFSARNDPLLKEVLTGRPSGNFPEPPTHAGHNHANWSPGSSPIRGGTTTLDDVGRDVSFNLGTWFYGTMRPPFLCAATGDEWLEVDCAYNDGAGTQPSSIVADTEASVIWGGVAAPVLRAFASSGGAGFATVAEHVFRLPANTDDNIGLSGPATSKIGAEVLIYKEGGGSATISLEIFDVDGANGFGFHTFTTALTGRIQTTFSNLRCSSNATGNGDVQKVRLRMSKTDDGTKVGIYGMTLFYDA